LPDIPKGKGGRKKKEKKGKGDHLRRTTSVPCRDDVLDLRRKGERKKGKGEEKLEFLHVMCNHFEGIGEREEKGKEGGEHSLCPLLGLL